jgi:5-methylcytosine-specific restriction endonuclease McrA
VTRASQSKYYEANKDEVKARAKKWNSDHPEKIKEKNSKYKKNFPEKDRALQAKRRAQKTQAGGSYTSAEWFTLCFACGFRCLCCGEVKPLEADHVVPVCHGGSSFLHNIQPLCGECNRHKSKKYTDYRLKEGKDSWQMKWEYWIL